MRKLIVAASLALSVLAAPTVASAQSFELSLGTGLAFGDSVIDDTTRIPTNVMLTLGYAGLPIIEPQLGILGDLGDVENSDFDLQLRPQLKISPPVIPFYARVILSVVNLIGDGDTEVYYGGGLGFELPLPLTPFVEGAILPTSISGFTVFEVRAGLGF
ncbi:MAG: hypothetical protein AAF658_02250 [Myxococcota bacterium]